MKASIAHQGRCGLCCLRSRFGARKADRPDARLRPKRPVVLLLFLSLPASVLAAPETPSEFFPALYYPDSPDSAGASSITLQPGETSSPLVLAPSPSGGSVALRVLDEDGTPVAGILVETTAGRLHAFARSGGDGLAVVTGVPAGDVIVGTRPDDPRSETGAFALRYAPGVTDAASATRFQVSNDASTNAGELRLPLAGRVKTVILDPAAAPWPGIPVVLRATDGSVRYRRLTDGSGRAAFGGLEPGAYRLWVDALGTAAVTECSDGSRDTSAATPIDVERGGLISDVTIATDRGGEVRGAIRDLTGNQGLPGLEVRFLPVSSPGVVRRYVTDRLGFYFAFGLRTDAYKIYVPAIRRWYPSAQTEAGARTVSVTEGGELDAIDVRGELNAGCPLPPGVAGTIEGGVQADFTRLPSAQIIAWNGPDSFRVTVTQTSIYRIECLPAGSYRVAFVPDGVYRTQYHPLTNDPASARAVTVTAGDTTRSVNFFPQLGVVLEGSVVSAADGGGIDGMTVTAVERAGGAVATTQTADGGRFRIDRLPNGTGLPAGDWILASDSIAISTIVPTPAIAVSLEGEWTRGGVLLRFRIPDRVPLRDWRVERERKGHSPVVVADASSHVEGSAARACVDPNGTGGDRYRLIVVCDRLGESAVVRSDWVTIPGPSVGRWSVSPHPWDGKGWLRLPSAVARGEKVALFEPNGRCVARLEASGERIALPGGSIPASGVYFLRWRDAIGRERSARLVIER